MQAPQTHGFGRGSQDSNLESPVLETGALASWATAPGLRIVAAGAGRRQGQDRPCRQGPEMRTTVEPGRLAARIPRHGRRAWPGRARRCHQPRRQERLCGLLQLCRGGDLQPQARRDTGAAAGDRGLHLPERRSSGVGIGLLASSPTPKLAKRSRCKRFIGFGRALNFKGRAAGDNKIAFNGKVSGRALRPGFYRASITAKDAAGNSSAPRAPDSPFFSRTISSSSL